MTPELTHLGRLVGRTDKFVRAWGDRCLAPLGATVTDWILLYHISVAPSPGLSQSQIARFAVMGGPALVRHVDRLEQDGMVVRRRDPHDRRVVRVTLTERGTRRLGELREVVDDCDRQLRSLLSPDDQVVLQRALDTLFEFAYAEVHKTQPGIPHGGGRSDP